MCSRNKKSIIHRLKNVLGSFQLEFQTLKPKKIDDKTNVLKGWGLSECIGNVDEALLFDIFTTEKNKSKNQLIHRIYQLNLTFYQKLWQELTAGEKSVIYDTAEDNVINMHKDEVVETLINKGILLNGQYLKLSNLSFVHFVRTQKRKLLKLMKLLGRIAELVGANIVCQ